MRKAASTPATPTCALCGNPNEVDIRYARIAAVHDGFLYCRKHRPGGVGQCCRGRQFPRVDPGSAQVDATSRNRPAAGARALRALQDATEPDHGGFRRRSEARCAGLQERRDRFQPKGLRALRRHGCCKSMPAAIASSSSIWTALALASSISSKAPALLPTILPSSWPSSKRPASLSASFNARCRRCASCSANTPPASLRPRART